MTIFADKKIKGLFLKTGCCLSAASIIFIILTAANPEHRICWIAAAALAEGAGILGFMLYFFIGQHKILEKAVEQIQEYSGGNANARIPCDEEGQLYRLFHEVNSLAAILNAHREKEEQGKKFMKDTLSDISHQLKTPLAALNIYNGIIQEEAENPSAIKEFSNLSEQELERIEGLVQNLLKMARLDAGSILLERSEENVAEMMETIERQFSYRARQEGKKLRFLGGDKVSLCCDRRWLTEAVGNLIKNGLDHTEKGDSLDIEWKSFSSMVQIVVKDSGKGIHPEDLPHIFKRFYRSRFSTDTQGAGLGLSLAKAVVEAQGGTIEADSRLGEGTVFTMNFLISGKREEGEYDKNK